jgi:hypothetical protein
MAKERMRTSFVSKSTGKVWEVIKTGEGYVIQIRGVEVLKMTAVPFQTKREACEVLEYFRQICGV